MATNCKMCGTQNPDGAQTCSACGSPLPGATGQSKPQAKGGGAKTMMFGQAPQIPKPAQPAAAAPTAPRPATGGGVAAKTLLAVPGATAPVAAAAAKPAPAPPPRKPADDKRTVLGMPAVTGAAQAMAQASAPQAPAPQAPAPRAPAPQAPAPPPRKPADDKRTVLGMPAVTGAAQAMAQAAAPQAPAPQAAPSAPAQPSEPAAPPAGSLPKETMPLEPAPKISDDKPTVAASPDEPLYSGLDAGEGADSWPDDEYERAPAKKGSGLLIVAIVASVMVVAGVGLLAYMLLLRKGPELTPQVFATPDGQSLRVALAFPEAPPGTAIQVGGQTVQIAQGQAQFDLPLSQMSLGPNSVQVLYTEPGAAPENLSFPIVLRHTASVDMSGLVMADPFFMVRFEVADGIRLAVEGRPVQLTAGEYSHRVALSQVVAGAEASGDTIVHKVPFQLTDADGHTEQGEQTVTIPVTGMRVDRPANGAVVDLEAVTCAGTTEEGAQVTVNGEPVGVTAAGFNTTVPLAAPGEHMIEIVSRAPGKAPRTEVVRLNRVQSLDDAIAEWSKQMGEKLDYPSLARDANSHAGKKIELSGRVVNITTEKGVTVFLLYVGEGCPAGARCAVYAVFRGETDAGLQSNVEVYGTVRGTTDVELRSGQKETMPALDVDFVVEVDADRGKKKGKRKKR